MTSGILFNNYCNLPYEQFAADELGDHYNKADYCIPLIVPKSIVKDVAKEATIEVSNAGYGPGKTVLGEAVREGRDISVVVLTVGTVIKTAAEEEERKEMVLRTVRGAKASGDREAIEEALDDPSFAVRRCALEAIASVVTPGDAKAFGLIAHGLEDPDWTVRRAAVQAMTKVAPPGNAKDAKAIELVSLRLDDEQWVVRVAAVRAIPKVAFISPHMEDADWYVRKAAMETIVDVAPQS